MRLHLDTPLSTTTVYGHENAEIHQHFEVEIFRGDVALSLELRIFYKFKKGEKLYYFNSYSVNPSWRTETGDYKKRWCIAGLKQFPESFLDFRGKQKIMEMSVGEVYIYSYKAGLPDKDMNYIVDGVTTKITLTSQWVII